MPFLATGSAEAMQLKSVESGTFWVFDAGDKLPPASQARVNTDFEELMGSGADELAVALNLTSPRPILSRMQQGRRCFVLRRDGEITAYGWVSQGPENVGELERRFNLRADEAYIWDCGTLPQWRRKRLYSYLLSRVLFQMCADGVTRIWIGASRQNYPSIRGIENAGFRHVLDLVYRRLYRLTFLRFRPSPVVRSDLVHAAYHVILQDYEKRFGTLALGWYRSS